MEGLVHGVDGAGVGQGQAGVLGEGQQHLLLDPAVGPPGVVGGDGQAAHDHAVLVDGGGHGRLEAPGGELGQGRGARSPRPRPDGPRRWPGRRPRGRPAAADPLEHLRLHAGGRDQDSHRGVVGVEQPQGRDAVPDQLPGPADDRVKDLVERGPGRDRPLDLGQPLEQALALLHQLVQPGDLDRPALGLLDPAQHLHGQGQHPAHAPGQVGLLAAEPAGGAGQDQSALLEMVQGGDQGPAGAEAGQLDAAVTLGGARAARAGAWPPAKPATVRISPCWRIAATSAPSASAARSAAPRVADASSRKPETAARNSASCRVGQVVMTGASAGSATG